MSTLELALRLVGFGACMGIAGFALGGYIMEQRYLVFIVEDIDGIVEVLNDADLEDE